MLVAASSPDAGFNSNLVRLKGTQYPLTINQLTVFQFQSGAIERDLGKTTATIQARFNSNLVRLKAKRRSRN